MQKLSFLTIFPSGSLTCGTEQGAKVERQKTLFAAGLESANLIPDAFSAENLNQVNLSSS